MRKNRIYGKATAKKDDGNADCSCYDNELLPPVDIDVDIVDFLLFRTVLRLLDISPPGAIVSIIHLSRASFLKILRHRENRAAQKAVRNAAGRLATQDVLGDRSGLQHEETEADDHGDELEEGKGT